MAFAQATEDLPEFRNSMDQTLAIQFSGISAEQEDAYLLRLGMTTDMAVDMSERHWRNTGSGRRKLVTPWGTLTEGAGVKRVALLGRSMEVRTAEFEDGVRFTDDLGGDRVERYGMFPMAACDSRPSIPCEALGLHRIADTHGPLAEVLRDERGYPLGVRYGETLMARYHFGPADLAGLGEETVVPEWIELIDTRTGGAILDTRLFEDPPAMPWFIVLAGGLSTGDVLVRAEMGGPLHAVMSAAAEIYALLPVDGGEIWRSAEVYADGWSHQDAYRARLDYTEGWMRLHLGFPGDGKGVVLEAPRRASSAAPARLLHPDLPLPAIDTEAFHELAMPASVPPGPERFVIPPDWRVGLPVIRSPDHSERPQAVVSGMGGGPSGPGGGSLRFSELIDQRCP